MERAEHYVHDQLTAVGWLVAAAASPSLLLRDLGRSDHAPFWNGGFPR